MQIVLRILVGLLGLGGAAGAAFLAITGSDSLAKAESQIYGTLHVSSLDEVLKLTEVLLQFQPAQPSRVQELNNAIEALLRTSRGIWFLYAAAGLGLFGIVLGVLKQGKCAAAVLLAAAVGPAIILPAEALPALGIFTCALPLAGLVAYFIRPGHCPYTARAPE